MPTAFAIMPVHFYICIPVEEKWGIFSKNLIKYFFVKSKTFLPLQSPNEGYLCGWNRGVEKRVKKVGKKKRVDRDHD